MQLLLNGQQIDSQAQNLAMLLEQQQIDPQVVACALNGQFIPRQQYANTELTHGCRLEVLSPMQGG